MAVVTISDEVLKWLVQKPEFSDLKQEARDKVLAWQRGEKKPTFKELEKISKSTGIPFGFFFLQEPPKEEHPLLECRTVEGRGISGISQSLRNVIQDMELAQDWMSSQLRSEGASVNGLLGCLPKRGSAVREDANRIRELLGINEDWFTERKSHRDHFQYMRTGISENGVLVMMSGIVGLNTAKVLDIEEFRAFALIDDYAPLIFINGNDGEGARLFSLLHELAHIALGVSDLFNSRYDEETAKKEAEKRCNAIAAEIMVPDGLFEERWSLLGDLETKQRIDRLSEYFCCGKTVIARKALDHGLIGKALYREVAESEIEAYRFSRSVEKERPGGGDFYRAFLDRADPRFLERLVDSVESGETQYTEALRLTHLDLQSFNEVSERQ